MLCSLLRGSRSMGRRILRSSVGRRGTPLLGIDLSLKVGVGREEALIGSAKVDSTPPSLPHQLVLVRTVRKQHLDQEELPASPPAMMADELPPFLRLALEGKERHDTMDSEPASSTIARRPPPLILVPPLNFANVAFGISRSGHPNERNYEFLRRLKLKTILYVANDDYRPGISAFAQQEGIKVLHCRISVNKEPFAVMEDEEVAQALGQLVDTRNHPIL